MHRKADQGTDINIIRVNFLRVGGFQLILIVFLFLFSKLKFLPWSTLFFSLWGRKVVCGGQNQHFKHTLQATCSPTDIWELVSIILRLCCFTWSPPLEDIGVVYYPPIMEKISSKACCKSSRASQAPLMLPYKDGNQAVSLYKHRPRWHLGGFLLFPKRDPSVGPTSAVSVGIVADRTPVPLFPDSWESLSRSLIPVSQKMWVTYSHTT